MYVESFKPLPVFSMGGYEMKWEKIETAPDDRQVLLYNNNTKEIQVGELMTQTGTGEKGWVTQRWQDEDSWTCLLFKNPTHWCELPPPPE